MFQFRRDMLSIQTVMFFGPGIPFELLEIWDTIQKYFCEE
jgi:hypothetical protein